MYETTRLRNSLVYALSLLVGGFAAGCGISAKSAEQMCELMSQFEPKCEQHRTYTEADFASCNQFWACQVATVNPAVINRSYDCTAQQMETCKPSPECSDLPDEFPDSEDFNAFVQSCEAKTSDCKSQGISLQFITCQKPNIYKDELFEDMKDCAAKPCSEYSDCVAGVILSIPECRWL